MEAVGRRKEEELIRRESHGIQVYSKPDTKWKGRGGKRERRCFGLGIRLVYGWLWLHFLGKRKGGVLVTIGEGKGKRGEETFLVWFCLRYLVTLVKEGGRGERRRFGSGVWLHW